MKKLTLMAATTAAVTLLSGCATLFTGTRDTLRFETNPAGAVVEIDGYEVCRTPCTTSVGRSVAEKDAIFRLDGYTARVVKLDKEFNIISVLNLNNPIGWVVDAVSGSLMKYKRKVYTIELERDNRMTLTPRDRIIIDTKRKTVEIRDAE